MVEKFRHKIDWDEFSDAYAEGLFTAEFIERYRSCWNWKNLTRNRLQAALSDFVVVAQCPAKSGTLYTVNFALEYGKPVFAVDFGFRNEINAGNRQLLSQGVRPIHYADLCHNLT